MSYKSAIRTVLNLMLIKKSIYVDLRPLADLGTMTETVFTNFKEILIQSIPKGKLRSIKKNYQFMEIFARHKEEEGGGGGGTHR